MDKSFEVFKKYKESVKSLLANAADVDVNEEEISQLVQRLLDDSNVVSGKDFSLPDELYFVIGKQYIQNHTEIKKSINLISKSVEDILLVIIVDSIEEKIQSEGMSKGLPKSVTVRTICAQQSKKDSHYISIDTRLNSMMFFGNNSNSVHPEGHLFIAKLYDLVALYNVMGDLLFEKNVRYSISSDKNSVDTAIQETLEKEPNNFWFYNNGITILADKIECYDTNTIKIYSSPENNFSVINGAQTITACANYFFKPNADKQRLIEARNAYVLLRVITVKKSDKDPLEEKRKIERKISVSLNRQKPIDYEDLAFNSNLVLSINSLTADSAIDFTICRKGEKEIDEEDHTYLLSEVARYILASKLQSPGQAKNMYKGSILKMEGDSFKKKDILPEIDGKSFQKNFISQYGLVNISDRLFKGFSRINGITDHLTEEQKKQYGQLFDNGHYYFVAIVIRALFIDSIGEADDKVNIDRIKLVDKKLDEDAIRCIENLYKTLVLSSIKEESVEYSDIKKDTLYKKIAESPSYKVFMNEVAKFVFTTKGIAEIKEKRI